MALTKLNMSDLPQLIENIENNGGDASALRAVLEESPRYIRPGEKIMAPTSDEVVEELRSKAQVEEGEGLECQICHHTCSRLTSGACDACFRVWTGAGK